MAYENLVVDMHEHVALVTLNRPDKLNALSGALQREMLDVCRTLDENDEVRVLVWTGAGRGFCSGADLTGGGRPGPQAAAQEAQPQAATPQPQATPRAGGSRLQRLDEFGWVGRQAKAASGFSKPTIAAVNGVAAGAGMSLALACDMRVGSANSRFRTVFIERNLSPDSGMSYFLPRIVGYSRAADLIFTSRDVNGEEAYRLGLLDRFVPHEQLVDEALALGKTIASWPPLAMQSAKRVLQHNINVVLEEALKYESVGLDYGRKATNDAAESRRAFAEKRPGVFTGT